MYTCITRNSTWYLFCAKKKKKKSNDDKGNGNEDQPNAFSEKVIKQMGI
jgi:hypothetical protein